MNSAIRYKLFAMMFLEFFIWGAWLPLIFGYLPELGFTEMQQALILNAFPVAAMLAMFFSNQFADRNFAAEKFLAVSHLIGGVSILALAWVTDFWTFLILMSVHCFFYVPTISISNAIAFNAMKDAQQEFGIVRMGGTIGWIAAAWPFYFLLQEKEGAAAIQATASTFIVAGLASLALAAFSLALPHTPPQSATAKTEGAAWLRAMRLLSLPFVFVLWIATFLDSFVHSCYFSWTERFLGHIGIEPKYRMIVMSIGQVAEIATMAILGIFLKRLGWRTTMMIGILGHAVRFAVFAFLPDMVWLVVAVNILHGICYAFFFATVYIFVDEYFPKDVRSSAQGLFNLMILGLGPFAANFAGPFLYKKFIQPETADFKSLFMVPMTIAIFAALFLAIAFWPPRNVDAKDPARE